MNRKTVFRMLMVILEIAIIVMVAISIVTYVNVITAQATPRIVNGEYIITEINTQDDAIEITEAPPMDDVSSVLDEVDAEFVDNPYLTIPISDEEYEELRWVIALEANTQGLDGEMAVCEVIFNRVLSPHDWGNGVHGVLSKKGQFATYKYIGSRKAWAVPGEQEDDAISEVLRKGPSILPDMKYVYFDSKGGVNGSRKFKLKDHTFGAEK